MRFDDVSSFYATGCDNNILAAVRHSSASNQKLYWDVSWANWKVKCCFALWCGDLSVWAAVKVKVKLRENLRLECQKNGI